MAASNATPAGLSHGSLLLPHGRAMLCRFAAIACSGSRLLPRPLPYPPTTTAMTLSLHPPARRHLTSGCRLPRRAPPLLRSIPVAVTLPSLPPLDHRPLGAYCPLLLCSTVLGQSAGRAVAAVECGGRSGARQGRLSGALRGGERRRFATALRPLTRPGPATCFIRAAPAPGTVPRDRPACALGLLPCCGFLWGPPSLAVAMMSGIALAGLGISQIRLVEFCYGIDHLLEHHRHRRWCIGVVDDR
ncbi:hypothetical protein JOD67_001700 [Tenggerimyces flavus]|nr:hypothetical protein [Tenggerimyces flavus]